MDDNAPAEFDEAEFHRRQERRLCSPQYMPPLQGAWAVVLEAELRRLVPTHFQWHGSAQADARAFAQAVVQCFASTPRAALSKLLHALFRASQRNLQLDEAAAVWVTELTIYAAMRAINPQAWGSLPGSSVYRVPVQSSLIAALGVALLTGRYLRLGGDNKPSGVVEVTATPAGSDPLQFVLGFLYDRLFADKLQRPNPVANLTQQEVGELRDKVEEMTNEDQLALGFLLVLHLSPDVRDDLAQQLSSILKVSVVNGGQDYADDLLHGETTMTPAQLEAALKKVHKLLPYFGPRSPAPAPPAPIAAPAPTTAPTPSYTYDIFISHASEDKAAFVDRLAAGLAALGLRVWYDKQQIFVGDSIREKVDEGLRESRYGVVVFSQHYMRKGWANGELDTLLDRQFSNGRKRVLPVWLGLTKADVHRHSPLLAARLAVDASKNELPAVLSALLLAINSGS